MNSNHLEELIKNIQATIKCPNCGSSYKREEIRFLGQLGQAVLVQLDCYVCKMPVMATIVVSGNVPRQLKSTDNIEDIKEIKELQSKIRQEKQNTESITADEVLDFHQFMKDFKGDFKDLFNK